MRACSFEKLVIAPSNATSSPSHFGSNNHPRRENTCSVSVANIGATHFGCALFRSLALASAGSPSSSLRPDIEFHLSTDAPRQAKARSKNPLVPTQVVRPLEERSHSSARKETSAAHIPHIPLFSWAIFAC